MFISHDSKDNELAEEFSNLLKRASAGGLKAFMSTDNKGNQGIEYGVEWYPEIINRINESSDIVCLLTTNSINRPWLLYEAGVAKGKLDKRVIGLAIGVQLSQVTVGPFAQFQNTDWSIDSITKLVIELVTKVPNLDPEIDVVRPLVESFYKKSGQIQKKNKGVGDKSKSDNVETNDVAKLFEEVKIMFDTLPSKLEVYSAMDSKRKKYSINPMYVRDLIHLAKRYATPYIGFQMVITLFQNDYPWFYNCGIRLMELKQFVRKSEDTVAYILEFEKSMDLLRHPIFMHEQRQGLMLGFEGIDIALNFLHDVIVQDTNFNELVRHGKKKKDYEAEESTK